MRIKERKNKERDLRATPKLRLQYHRYHQKNLNEINLNIPRNVTNSDWSRSYLSPKKSKPPIIFERQI